MPLLLSFDPANPHETRQAVTVAAQAQGTTPAELFGRLFADGERGVAEAAEIRRLCLRMLDPSRYGSTRRGLVRVIAEAAPNEVSREDLYAAAAAIDPTKNAGQVVGGLHGNLEQSWRSLGGPGVFVTTTPTGFSMRAELADVVLSVLGDD
jgi:hypothetical protein